MPARGERLAARARMRRALLRAWATASRPFAPQAGPPWPQQPRILVVRPDHLGDLLFAGPAFRLLRTLFPTARITALVGPWSQEVAKRSPGVDEVRTCDFPGFTRQPKGSPWSPYRQLLREARKLRGFDLAVALRFDHWWGALLAHTAGIPRRWGYAIPECAPFLTAAAPYTAGRHEVEQNLRLIEACAEAERLDGTPEKLDKRLSFPVTQEERAFADAYLAQHDVASGDLLVGIHPGAGAAVKLWPAERYARVADALAEQRGARILLTGSSGELGLAWAIASAMRRDALVAAGETTLGQLAALLARCQLVLGSDSGPLHLAVAVGAPTLHLYGPVDPRLFGPWAPGCENRHPVIASACSCAPCNRLDYPPEELAAHPCMEEIGVDEVLQAAHALLQRVTAPR